MLAVPTSEKLKKYLSINFVTTKILGSSEHGLYNDIEQTGNHLGHLNLVLLIVSKFVMIHSIGCCKK